MNIVWVGLYIGYRVEIWFVEIFGFKRLFMIRSEVIYSLEFYKIVFIGNLRIGVILYKIWKVILIVFLGLVFFCYLVDFFYMNGIFFLLWLRNLKVVKGGYSW